VVVPPLLFAISWHCYLVAPFWSFMHSCQPSFWGQSCTLGFVGQLYCGQRMGDLPSIIKIKTFEGQLNLVTKFYY